MPSRTASVSIAFLRDAEGSAILRPSLPLRLWRLAARARERHVERQMALAVLHLDHPDVIADFRRARRDDLIA